MLVLAVSNKGFCELSNEEPSPQLSLHSSWFVGLQLEPLFSPLPRASICVVRNHTYTCYAYTQGQWDLKFGVFLVSSWLVSFLIFASFESLGIREVKGVELKFWWWKREKQTRECLLCSTFYFLKTLLNARIPLIHYALSLIWKF